MKILWIISSGWKEGGAENYVALMRPIFERSGHEVKILSSDARSDQPHYNDYSFKAHTGLFSPFFNTFNPSAYFTLKKVLREFKPDVVHIHTIGCGSPALLYPLKKYPTFLTMHGPEAFVKSLLIWCFPSSYFTGEKRGMENLNFWGKFRYFYHRIFLDHLYDFGLRNVDTVISPSRYMQDLIMHEGFTSVLLPHAAQLFDHRPISRDALNHTLAFAGRLERIKGVDFLLRAMPAILKKYPDAKLDIAGDGPDRAILENLARELKINDAVSFVGRLDRSAMGDFYERAMVLIVPSIWVETFGTVGVEVMSVGRPVIGSNTGGMSDWLIDGETGFLVSPRDSTAIQEAVLRLFSDPDLLLRMMHNARKKAEEFGLDVHVEKLIVLYQGTLRKTEGTIADSVLPQE